MLDILGRSGILAPISISLHVTSPLVMLHYNVPTRFFRVGRNANYMYTLANGVAIRSSALYGENYIKGGAVGAEVRTVELTLSGNLYHNVNGDDVDHR